MSMENPPGGRTFRMWPDDFVQSTAFFSLHPGCKAILIDLCSYLNGRNNGDVSYSIPQAMASAQCSRRSAIRRLGELRDAGLVEVTRKGGFDFRNGKGEERANKWRITFMPDSAGQ